MATATKQKRKNGSRTSSDGSRNSNDGGRISNDGSRNSNDVAGYRERVDPIGVRLRTVVVACVITVVLAIGGSYAVASVVAPRGATGAQGIQGAQGLEGERGPRGHHGRTGKTGVTGASGANGANGQDGATVERACSNDIDVPLPYC